MQRRTANCGAKRTVHADSREEAIRLWQAFRDEISGKPVAAEPPAQRRAITFAAFVTEYLEKICARRAQKTLAIYRTIAFTRLIPYFGEKPLDAIRSCDVEDFMAAMLAECSPAYVNNCARTVKALMNHAVKRQLIATSPLTEKIRFEDVPLPELELNDEERLAFLGAFDDERGFKQDVAERRRDAHVVTSEHFKTPRKFEFGPNPESDTTCERFARFRSLKPWRLHSPTDEENKEVGSRSHLCALQKCARQVSGATNHQPLCLHQR